MGNSCLLTAAIADRFLSGDESVELSAFTVIENKAAEKLAGYEGILRLSGIRELSDAAAASLSKHKGDYLILDGLSSLSDSVAGILAKHKGVLALNGIESLSDAAASELCKHRAGPVTLCGLKRLNDTPGHLALAARVGNHAAYWTSWRIFFAGLEEIGPQAMALLSKHDDKHSSS